jgi:predicted nuclease of predicted toxin-antitoxin system
LYPETGEYKSSADYAVQKIAESQGRVLVFQEKDFGQFDLKPEDVPHGAIWLRPRRISQTCVGELFTGLCRILTHNSPSNPYDFTEKIVEVYEDRIDVRMAGGIVNTYPIPPVVVH